MFLRITLLVIISTACHHVAWAISDNTPEIPLVKPPQDLRDEQGLPEKDLINPFRNRNEQMSDDKSLDNNGLQRTSLGEVSEDFRILAIAIPADPKQKPMALIRLSESSDPTLVHPGDLVRSNIPSQNAKNTRRRNTSSQNALGADVQALMNRYTFYLHIKDIQPTFLELYHNKKRPDETTIISL